LIDAMLLLGFLPIPIRFLAKSTLWEHSVVKYLVRLAGAIPVYRKQDAGSDTSQNVSTFAASHKILKDAGAVAMFPEGVSHTSPHLMPMKTGAARIALEAEKLYGPLGIRIVPVGLLFEARGKFRSSVLIQVGEPIDPIDPTEHSNLIDPGADSGDVFSINRTVVRELTERIDRGLRQVTLNYDSWQEARLIERAAEIYQRESTAVAGNLSLASGFATKMAVLDRYQDLRAGFPQPVENLVHATREYDHLLDFLGLRDSQVAADYSLMRSVRFTCKSLLTLFMWLPLAALGTLLNWLPYRTPGWVARSVKLEADVEATYRVLSAVAVFPIIWVAEAVCAGRLFGAHIGLAVGVLAPLTGYVALRFHETRTRLGEEVRAFLFLKTRRVVAAELKMKRNRISREMNALIFLAEEREESV
jgi:glycerol-3-phosphate O-acyltransferase/dihydroxyacetone phosphate acyltransferase